MKHIKIFALAVGMLSLAACSDDKKVYNTSADVEVEMGESELTARENRGIFNVPVNLVGKANGNVVVTVDVEAVGESPAHEAEMSGGNRVGNYVITSKTLNIPEGVTSVNVQINAVDDEVINDDRTFKVVIVKAEGASIDKSKDATLITLKDDDRYPYEKLQGDWVLSFKGEDGSSTKYDVTIEGYEEGRPNYNKVLRLEGLFTTPYQIIKTGESLLYLNYFYDEATDDCQLELAFGQDIGTINAEIYPDYGGCTVYNYGLDETGTYLLDDGYLEGEVSKDRKTVTFSPDVWMLFCFPYRNQYLTLDGGYSFELTRK